MATTYDDVLSWLSAAASVIVTDTDDAEMVADRIEAAPGLSAEAFAAEAIDLARIIGESVRTADGFKQIAVFAAFETDAGEKAVTLLATVAQAVAIGRVEWPSRPAARMVRASFVALAHRAYGVAAALGPDLYAWLAGLVSVAVRLVSDRAANATPVVIVETGISLPSSVLAYQLYGKAGRATALVEIAASATPMIMPARFEALAS